MLNADELVPGSLYKVMFKGNFSINAVPIYKDSHRKVDIIGRVTQNDWVMPVKNPELATEHQTKVVSLMVLTRNDLCGFIHVTDKITFEEYNL